MQRFATWDELAERMAARMRAENDMDISWEQLALAGLEGLAELGVPVDTLVSVDDSTT